MNKRQTHSIVFCVLTTGLMIGFSMLLAMPGHSHVPGGQERPQAGIERIQHIVYIIKENRTFDNYFGTFAGADGATSGTISTGDTIPLGHTPDRTPRDISHSFQSA